MDGVEYLDGTDAYAGAVPLDQAEVVVGVLQDPQLKEEEWQANLDALGEGFGLRVRVQAVPFERSLVAAGADATDADVYVVAGQAIADAAADRPLLDLRAFIDEAQLVDDYGSYLVSLSRVGAGDVWPSDNGPIYGVAVGNDSKATVWTNEPEFGDLGYRAPSDWASFLALAEQMVADGHTPFCFGLESGLANGWPATDWVEMVVLRTGGPELYDAWVRHDVPFNHPVVVEAIRTVGELAHGPGFLDVPPQEAALRNFLDAVIDFAQQPGACLMTLFPSSLPSFTGAGFPVGSFPYPAFGLGFDDAVLGSGAYAVAVTDRPEIRRLMEALASPEWGLGGAQRTWPLTQPANVRFDTTAMVNPYSAQVVAGTQEAIRSGNLRIDGSDNMPPEIGQGAFWAGMVRLFREGTPENLDELSLDIASGIEATWLEVEATAD